MRLGEIKQIIDESLAEDDTIFINEEPIYGGNAYRINGYSGTISALKNLARFNWSGLNEEDIDLFLTKYPLAQNIDLPPEAREQLNSFLQLVNQKLPLFYSILETIVGDQDEQTINIRLPETVETITEINQFNEKLGSMFKAFNLAGEFKLTGFDRGSKWYEILITAKPLYDYFIGCLDIALQIFQLKKSYGGSKEADLHYLASLEKGKEPSSRGKKAYIEKYANIMLEENAKELINNVGETNGKEKPELCTNLIKATKDLVERLGDGVEFHLSYNPPEYAEEKCGSLTIDYTKIRQIKADETKAPKQLPAQVKEAERQDASE